MKEYERLFAQNNENGVSQFWHFGHDKHKGPVSGHTILFNKTVIEGGETKVHRRFCHALMFSFTYTYLGMHKEWYIPCSERTCRNSGHVRRAPMILNSARVVFQRVKTPRISIFGRVDMYCWPPKISNMYRPAA